MSRWFVKVTETRICHATYEVEAESEAEAKDWAYDQAALFGVGDVEDEGYMVAEVVSAPLEGEFWVPWEAE